MVSKVTDMLISTYQKENCVEPTDPAQQVQNQKIGDKKREASAPQICLCSCLKLKGCSALYVEKQTHDCHTSNLL